MQTLWRLDDLVQRSQHLLALLPAGVGGSRRVQWHPDARLVRYYTTLGLLDRPAAMQGRTAYYRDRHLLQLLAIKTLQARGLSLQTIQTELAGQANAVLAERIGLPADWEEQLAAASVAFHSTRTQAESVDPSKSTTRFWERLPVASSVPLTAAASVDSADVIRPPPIKMTECLAVTLVPGAQLLLDRRRYPELGAEVENALQTLSIALLATARVPKDPTEGD